MQSSACRKITCFLLLLVFTRCAQVVPLSGGKRDTRPPELLKAIPASGSTKFSATIIVFEFDEFVQVRDLSNELLISPKPDKTPDVKASGKKVEIDLSGCKLKPNTTYRFSFGKSIADMNESNPVPGLDYVFSTGDVLDTLKIRGQVHMATDNSPATGMIAGLYLNPAASDSLPYKNEPDYIAKTGSNGEFTFESLPPSQFALYVVADKNKNLLYDGETEQIAFAPRPLVAGKDSFADLSMFREKASMIFMKKKFSPFPGFAQLIYSQAVTPQLSPLRSKDAGRIWFNSAAEDSISLFYHDISDTLALVDQSAGKADTIYISIPVRRSKTETIRYRLLPPAGIPKKDDGIVIQFPLWMDTASLQRKKLKLLHGKDSLIALSDADVRWKNIHELELKVLLNADATYSFKADSGSLRALNRQIPDTSVIGFKTKGRTDFGKLSLKLTLARKKPYIIRLVTEEMRVVAERTLTVPLASSNAVMLDFPELPQGTYRVVLIWDENGNGTWDTGNVLRKQQPEKVNILSKQIKIPSDWEVEEEISEK